MVGPWWAEPKQPTGPGIQNCADPDCVAWELAP